MMLSDVVRPIFPPRNLVNDKLTLFHAISDPEESHVDRFRSLVLDGAISESNGGSVIDLDGCWGLRVAGAQVL